MHTEIEEIPTEGMSHADTDRAYHDLWHDYQELHIAHNDLKEFQQRVLEDILNRLYAVEHTPPPNAVQPTIHVNVDTGAISQALILGMKHLMEEQTKALIDGLSYTHNDMSIVESGSQNESQNHEPLARSQQARKASAKRANGSSNLDPFAVRKFRKNHTVPETARQFGVSESTIKRTLKSGK